MSEKPLKDDVLVRVENLKVHFPVYGGVLRRRVGMVKAVDGVSFDIKRGQTLGMVGESGCGKSTVGRAIINVLRYINPDVHIEGNIWYNAPDGVHDYANLPLKKMRPYRKQLQMIFQDPFSSLNPRFSVGQIIEEPLRIHTEMTREQRLERIGWLLDKVGLNPEQANRYPHEFSGGQRQRIGFARALATNPDLIIADEPVSALDVSIQAQAINLLEELQDEFDLTYLFIAHDLSVVYHISDMIAVMYLGHIVELGTSDQVYYSPKHPYSKALISAVPQPNPRHDRSERIILTGDVPTPMRKPSGCPFRTRCSYAQPSCAEEMPALEDKGEGHLSACPLVD